MDRRTYAAALITGVVSFASGCSEAISKYGRANYENTTLVIVNNDGAAREVTIESSPIENGEIGESIFSKVTTSIEPGETEAVSNFIDYTVHDGFHLRAKLSTGAETTEAVTNDGYPEVIVDSATQLNIRIGYD